MIIRLPVPGLVSFPAGSWRVGWLSQQTQSICITFVQCWTNVKDVGTTLYKCYINVLCLLGSPAADYCVCGGRRRLAYLPLGMIFQQGISIKIDLSGDCFVAYGSSMEIR